MGLLKRFWNSESGATAVEYTLLAAAIAMAIVVAVDQAGINLNDNAYSELQDIVH